MSAWFLPLVLLTATAGWLLGIADLSPTAHAAVAEIMAFAKQLFLGALKLVIAPLIFFSLLSGLLRLREAGAVRRLGGVTIAYYLTTTTLAIAVGLSIVHLWHPWTTQAPMVGAFELPDATLIDASSSDGLMLRLLDTILVNPLRALADLNILAIVANAVLIGVAGLLTLREDSVVVNAVHDLAQLMYTIAGWVVWLIPIGVMGIVFQLAADIDAGVIRQLLGFALVVFSATAFHALVVLPTLAWLATGEPPWRLLPRLLQPMLVAATTSSSVATLPVSLQTAETRLGVNRSIAAFVLPLGATINMDGTALFEGIAAVFLAYLFGVELGAFGVVTIFLVATIASIGAPGIPSGSMAGMQMVMLAVGIPLEAIGLLMLIERPLDTFRTSVNVEGDLIASLVAERFGNPRTVAA